MTCKEAVYRASDYQEGALPTSEAAEVEAHLENCARCRRYFKQTAQLIAAMQRLPRSDTFSPKAWAQIMTDFGEYHAQRRQRRRWVITAAALMATAGLGAIIWIAILRHNLI